MRNPLLPILHFILKHLALLVLRTRKPKIIAISGSIAKSSTKEAIYQVLKSEIRNPKSEIAKSEGNLNNEVGLPLAALLYRRTPRWWQWVYLLPFLFLKSLFLALRLIPYPLYLVLEMAADKPGDIEYLISIAKPFISVVTSVGPSHLQAFGTIEKVAEDKGKVVEILPKDGYAVLNKKDEKVLEMARKTQAEVLFFEPYKFDIAQKAAEKVGEVFGLDKKQVDEALKSATPLKGRMNILKGVDQSTILDDSYNSNPLSSSYALDFLKKYPGRRKIAVLGDMLELGGYSEEGHKKVGEKAKKCADIVLTQGPEARRIAEAANGKHFQTKDDLIKYLKSQLQRGDVVLIKASRGMKFEEIVDKIKKDNTKS